ncbi:hypothetical protein F441_15397 [Phytophthora nicotianae CJ01A1]|uniref:MULE transposase domain-containing protein n=2 Tax=Phytophthora nicotianae TaxID=4792 RepID=W2YP67_PHYNI|nr:hypothetical protein F441_15397 [Phytophthora nicotianae CJ01A1]ETP36726.1 hypothetical protein F442_15412 [Phytophthora nicotianae P10297]
MCACIPPSYLRSCFAEADGSALRFGDADGAQYNAMASVFVDCETETSAVRRWLADPDVEQFGEYFLQQWLTGKFVKWQCFRTPVGWVTTNNPVETFNAKLKKTYTLRERMLMGSLLGQLQVCCRMESVSGAEFHEKSTASSRLRRRATTLRRQRLLVETPSFDGSSNFVLVVSKATPRIYVKPKRKSMEVDRSCGCGCATWC